MKLYFLIVFSLFLRIASFAGVAGDDFLFDPHLVCPKQVAHELKEKTIDMSFRFGEKSHLRFLSKNSEVYFEILFDSIPECYQDFFKKIQGKLIAHTIEKKKRWIYSYKWKKGNIEEVNVLSKSESIHPDDDAYIVCARRVIEGAKPKQLKEEELEKIIRDTNVLFYTGAGISISRVPAMNQLYELLGLEQGEKFVPSLENAIERPKEFASKILTFHKACLSSAPTRAHFALKKLAMYKNTRIVTENVDQLHEFSGICPYRVDPKHLRAQDADSFLKKIDHIICVGLSFDDKGFLGWYKKHNPKGKIIAIDLKKPSYLGDEDFLVTKDLQEIIPRLASKIKDN